MDGGSSINFLYYGTFLCMGLADKNLKPSNTVFHGVVPGKSAYPVGKIALEVVFGDDHDSRSETVTFEVVKIRSLYHVFTTSLCKRDQKLHKRAVNSVEPAVPRYLRWSEQPIVWSREDHPPRVDNSGHLALVVAP